MTNSTEISYDQRIKRVETAIALGKPDRVPFFPQTNFLALRYGKLSGKEAFYDYEKWFSCCKSMNVELEPDLCWPALAATPGNSYDLLGCTQIFWPGHGAPVNSSIQFADKEYMLPDEIDHFIEDPTDFILRIYLPRVFDTLKPLAGLPSFKSLFHQGYKSVMTLAAFSSPEVAEAFRVLSEAVEEARKYSEFQLSYQSSLKEVGLVEGFSGFSLSCVFDVFGDYYRGVRGIMTDMFRRPEQLLAALDKLHPMLIARAKEISRATNNPRVFIPLHLGAEYFMSFEQFERFYWPYLKDMLITLVDEGLTPCPFFEGDYTSRLHYLAELPAGKIMGMFDQTDLFKAKEIIGDTMCIVGNMPVDILQYGTEEEIFDASRKLIDIVGKDGGFIMSSRSVLDTANADLVKKWGEFTKEYGTY